ncbi:UNVERIFIED_ORG: AraC-like DNA-binding protein [Heyndrickxia coagulans]
MSPLKKQLKPPSNFPLDFVYKETKGPEQELPDHYQDWYEIIFVHEGTGTFFIHNTFYEMSKGDVFLVPKDIIHHTIPNYDSPPTNSVIFFAPDIIHGFSYETGYSNLDIFQAAKNQNEYKISLSTEQQSMINMLLSKIFYENEQKLTGYKSAIVSCLNFILLSLYRIMRELHSIPIGSFSGPKWIQDTLEYIDTHLNSDLSLNALAARAFISPEHFSRVFKQMTGRTLTEYVNMKKIILAKELLVNSDDPISFISDKTGFRSLPHFYRMFKKHVGMTPSSYRHKNTYK